MTPLSFCPEASPHSVCKVRVPSFPQFDSVKAWKQIKACCFSPSRADTEPVRTRLTRGSFATCCFLFVMRPEECWHRFRVRLFVFFSLHRRRPPLCCFSVYCNGNMKLSCSKIVFVVFFYYSNDGLEMFTVGQCVWQRSLQTVKGPPRPPHLIGFQFCQVGVHKLFRDFCQWDFLTCIWEYTSSIHCPSSLYIVFSFHYWGKIELKVPDFKSPSCSLP